MHLCGPAALNAQADQSINPRTPTMHDSHVPFIKSIHYAGKVARLLIKDDKLANIGVTVASNKRKQFRFTAECVIANLITVMMSDLPDNWIFFSRKETEYKKHQIYGDMSYDAIIKITDALLAADLIEMELGYTNWNSAKSGRRSIMRPTNKFKSWLAHFMNATDQETELMKQLSNSLVDARKGVFVVKEQKSSKIIDTDELASNQLKAINANLDTHSFYLNNQPIPTSNLHYHGVGFVQDDVSLGGRIYNNIQNMPSKIRSQILINGDNVQEIDFKASHPSLLYSLVNEKLPADPYFISSLTKEENVALRPIIKIAMLVSINADSLNSASKALKKSLQDAYLADSSSETSCSCIYLYSSSSLKPLLSPSEGAQPPAETSVRKGKCTPPPHPNAVIRVTLEPLQKLIALIVDEHKAISEFFLKGFGLKCMGIEGSIALEVMQKLNELNVPTLNVHDSYICRKSDTGIVEETILSVLQTRGIHIRLEHKILATTSAKDLLPASTPVDPTIVPTAPATIYIVPAEPFDPRFLPLPLLAQQHPHRLFKAAPVHQELDTDDWDYMTCDFDYPTQTKEIK